MRQKAPYLIIGILVGIIVMASRAMPRDGRVVAG